MKNLCQGRSILYGTDDSAQIRAEHIACDEKGVRFTCRCFDRTFDVSVPVIGRHNVYNALAAIAAGYVTGLSDAELQAGLLPIEHGHAPGTPAPRALYLHQRYV